MVWALPFGKITKNRLPLKNVFGKAQNSKKTLSLNESSLVESAITLRLFKLCLSPKVSDIAI